MCYSGKDFAGGRVEHFAVEAVTHGLPAILIDVCGIELCSGGALFEVVLGGRHGGLDDRGKGRQASRISGQVEHP